MKSSLFQFQRILLLAIIFILMLVIVSQLQTDVQTETEKREEILQTDIQTVQTEKREEILPTDIQAVQTEKREEILPTDIQTVPTEKRETLKIKIESSAFKEGEMIPRKYTCDGENVSPPLQWDSVPEGTKSLALISDDPDAPVGIWVHWVIYNLPPDTRQLPEKIPPVKELDNGAIQGTNDFKEIGYGGPCPPYGTHRYFFKLYALDTLLNLPPGATKKQLLNAIEGHVLAEGELMGRYSR